MLIIFRTVLITFALAFATTAPIYGDNSAPITQELAAPDDPIQVSLLSETQSLQPGSPTWVALHIKIDDSWHAYWKNPGDAGMAPVVMWNLPEGFEVGPLVWPTPQRFTLGSATGFGYENDLTFLAQITPPASFDGNTAQIGADVRWIVCNDSTCLPGESQVTATFPLSSNTPTPDPANEAFFATTRSKTPAQHETATANRDDGLVVLSFQGLPVSADKIVNADFIPEEPGTINHGVPALLEKDDNGGVSLVLEDSGTASNLKGVLVVHTANEKLSFAINAPINSSGESEQVAIASPHADDELTLAAFDLPIEEIEFEGGVLLALLFAFVGGLLLNMMPCVLPVISFKVLGFVKMAGQSRSLILKHGISFSIGVLLSFWALASMLLILQAYGRSVGWGFQLQEPLFVAILAAMLFIFGLSLFGLFEIGATIMSAAGQAEHTGKNRNALVGSFLSGVLATAVATPCTGPFLGSAVGFAVTLPAIQALAIFTSLGIGMSSPYLVLAAFPSLLKFMPKPGQWMVTFKELMGFLMMASVIWLVWVFVAQTNSFSLILLLAAFFILAVGCWIYGRWAAPHKEKITRTTAIIATLLIFAAGCYTIALSTSTWADAMGGGTTAVEHNAVADEWEDFNPQRVAELRAKGIPVFIDFTAKWCLICQTNHMVLTGNDVSKQFNKLGVVKMKADWTKRDDTIAKELKKFGRNSVPLYVLYDGSAAEPQILPQVLTPDTVIDALKQVETTLSKR